MIPVYNSWENLLLALYPHVLKFEKHINSVKKSNEWSKYTHRKTLRAKRIKWSSAWERKKFKRNSNRNGRVNGRIYSGTRPAIAKVSLAYKVNFYGLTNSFRFSLKNGLLKLHIHTPRTIIKKPMLVATPGTIIKKPKLSSFYSQKPFLRTNFFMDRHDIIVYLLRQRYKLIVLKKLLTPLLKKTKGIPSITIKSHPTLWLLIKLYGRMQAKDHLIKINYLINNDLRWYVFETFHCRIYNDFTRVWMPKHVQLREDFIGSISNKTRHDPNIKEYPRRAIEDFIVKSILAGSNDSKVKENCRKEEYWSIENRNGTSYGLTDQYCFSLPLATERATISPSEPNASNRKDQKRLHYLWELTKFRPTYDISRYYYIKRAMVCFYLSPWFKFFLNQFKWNEIQMELFLDNGKEGRHKKVRSLIAKIKVNKKCKMIGKNQRGHRLKYYFFKELTKSNFESYGQIDTDNEEWQICLKLTGTLKSTDFFRDIIEDRIDRKDKGVNFPTKQEEYLKKNSTIASPLTNKNMKKLIDRCKELDPARAKLSLLDIPVSDYFTNLYITTTIHVIQGYKVWYKFFRIR